MSNIERNLHNELDALHEKVFQFNERVDHQESVNRMRLADVDRIDSTISALESWLDWDRSQIDRLFDEMCKLEKRVARLEDSTTVLGGADSAKTAESVEGVSRSGGLGEAAHSPACYNNFDAYMCDGGTCRQCQDDYDKRELSTTRDKCLPDCAGDCPACTQQQERDQIGNKPATLDTQQAAWDKAAFREWLCGIELSRSFAYDTPTVSRIISQLDSGQY